MRLCRRCALWKSEAPTRQHGKKYTDWSIGKSKAEVQVLASVSRNRRLVDRSGVCRAVPRLAVVHAGTYSSGTDSSQLLWRLIAQMQ